MGQTKVKIGDNYGEWTVIGMPFKRSQKYVVALCRCSCGIEREVATSKLWGGKTKTCGHSCRYPEVRAKKAHNIIHGYTRKGVKRIPEYSTWLGMKDRCNNPNNDRYRNYGGRGITVCPEWSTSFKDFFSYLGPKPSPEHSIDRINNNGNYEPGNVRWATIAEQHENQSHRGGVRKVATFVLERLEDVSGISGVGQIAEGIVFHDGQVALSWIGQYHTVEILPNIDTVKAIHGHGGKTQILWDH